MEVILLKDQRHLGTRGEVIKVKPGFARNYLLPQGIALEATPGNMKVFESLKAKIDALHNRERDAAQAIADRLEGTRIEDDALSVLSRIGSLRTLVLNNTPVTDAGLTHFDSATGLEALWLRGTCVTPAGVHRIKGRRPNLQVVADVDTR